MSEKTSQNKGQVYGAGISGQGNVGRRITVQGNYNEKIEGDYIQGNYYAGTDREDITQIASEIQNLLQQLAHSYSTNTTTGKMTIATKAIEYIDNSPQLTSRLLGASKAGGFSALEQLLNHPAASFLFAALEDWQVTKDNKI